MGSLGREVREEGKAMWLYPKLVGSPPSERWGHSACFFQGHLYVFGGCCGGMHFSDVLVLNLDTKVWSTLMTTVSDPGPGRNPSPGPGPRDSHSATLWENKIVVFGGTNGSKKVNDLHILDLGSSEWFEPACQGSPPPPRESHTATLVGGDKLVVFGGSGEGVANYLNDLHVLDLKTMAWTSPQVKGSVPPPRDSHVSIAVENKLFVYGGDCGDRYLGDVDVFDIETFMWSRTEVDGCSPGRRAGHAAVTMGNKVYVIGGVGDKKYYNDAWVLDTVACKWSRLEIGGQQPQGRFSHTALVVDSDIAIYGGCGEDERPLGELLILQLGGEHRNGRYSVSFCNNFGSHWSHYSWRNSLYGADNGLKKMVLGNCIKAEATDQLDVSSHSKKRRTNTNAWEREAEQEEHSLSLSQNSSPSPSDQEQTTIPNPTLSRGLRFPSRHQLNKYPIHPHSNKWTAHQSLPDVYFVGENRPSQKQRHVLPSWLTSDHGRSMNQSAVQNLMGAEVQGKVDGAFDSGYLMTATVNGRIFRGVLFAPGPNMRGSNESQSAGGQVTFTQPYNPHRAPVYAKRPMVQSMRTPVQAQSRDKEMRERPDLQGLVLTLGGPASGCGL